MTEEGKNMLLHMRSWFELVLKRRKEHLIQRHHYLTISANNDDGNSDSMHSPRVNARRIAVRAVWDRWYLWVECRKARREDPSAGNRLRVLQEIYETTATELGAHSFEHRKTFHRDSEIRMEMHGNTLATGWVDLWVILFSRGSQDLKSLQVSKLREVPLISCGTERSALVEFATSGHCSPVT